MSSTTLDAGTATGKIEAQRKLFNEGHNALMATFDATPEDKLNWKPSELSRSALQIAAHVAATNHFFLLAFQGRPPATELPEIFQWIGKKAEDWTTRDQVVAQLNSTRADLDRVFDNFTPEMLENEDAALALRVSAIHGYMHKSQLDFLQTCWGDFNMYFGN